MVEPLFCNLKNNSTLFRYISDLFGVCSYFILEQDKLIIIDPGKLNDNIFEWLNRFNNLKKVVYITHEHFDHHYHANKVFNLENTFLFSPSIFFCEALKDTRKNLSYFYNDPRETIADSITFEKDFEVFNTPGHSQESYCFVYDNIVFGGDTIIKKKYLVLKLPGSDKKIYNNTINFLKEKIDVNSIVCPGHGEYFCLENW